MPALKGKDLGSGPWVRPGARRESSSSVLCAEPRCGRMLHPILVEQGQAFHWLCGPHPMDASRLNPQQRRRS